MSTLKTRQQEMMAWLSGQNNSIAEHIAAQGGVTVEQRLQIYQNAYRIRLRETIDTDHPELGRYLGDELYNAMVDGYINHYPSSFTSLRQFADRLPEFLANTAPFSGYPQLAELARFERMLLAAFDAADSPRATIEELNQHPPQTWPELRFQFHPSVQIFSTGYNVVQIWQTLRGESGEPPAPQATTCHWVLWRNKERLTEFCSVSPLELEMLRCFLAGESLMQVAEFPAAEMPEDEAGSYLLNTLHQWLDRGWVRRLGTQAATPTEVI